MKFLLFFLALFALCLCDGIPLGPTPAMPAAPSNIEVLQVYNLPNPEEVAVDSTGTFFLTGGNDGYVYKVNILTGDKLELLTPKDFNPDYFEEWNDADIREYCNGDDLAKETVCGRVLGIKFSSFHTFHRSIYIANAYFGVYHYRFRGYGQRLTQLVAKTGSFINDVLPYGPYVFYTDSHTHKQRNQVPYVVMDLDSPAGSLNVYNWITGETTILADDFYFANGMALSSDGRYIYISETNAARIRKFNVFTMTMEEEYLASDLPVLTDNIYLEEEPCVWFNCHNEGTLLVPGYWRQEALDDILRDSAAMAEFISTSPAVHLPIFQSWIVPVGVILELDESTGEIQRTIFDNTGKFMLAASAHKLDEDEYIVGSVFAPFAIRFRLLD
ncbi:strictosidine synthase-related [Anaeramoeba flamelloides]|uniref:Strictosidine synthase-related n=1 Tax=Anaeramoeba flamelloides TaxID=1746091 RepID=A0ABQ8XIA7_9EUKA|nr:strictosidine synthase-related [Anaeramoeba flamelloides]